MAAHDRRQRTIDQLLADANEIAFRHQLRRESAICAGRRPPDVEASFVITNHPPRPERRKPKDHADDGSDRSEIHRSGGESGR